MTRAADPRRATVEIDDTLIEALRPFDLDPNIVTEFYPWLLHDELPTDFGIGLIVGASGSGKSTLLDAFGVSAPPSWSQGRAIVSHFDDATDAADRLYAVGLNSVPTWRQPYDTLSTGQKFRADLARQIGTGAVIDEFTSVVDRNVAKSASRALSAWVARNGTRDVVIASCHRDVIPWLRPDWVMDTDAGTLTVGDAEDIPQWYGQWVLGDEVGRLVLA
jgi:energy-coupling factor transporter ATP-binding protein EcfA2